jgi:Subtilase family
MRSSLRNLRRSLGFVLSGLLLTACCIGASGPAAAQFGRMGGFGHVGGFGRMGGSFGRLGGFGRPAIGGRRLRQRTIVRHRGGGRVVDRPFGGNARNAAAGDEGRPRHHRIGRRRIPRNGGPIISELPTGGHGGKISARRGGGRNNGGRGGVPPRGERRFVANEVITAFLPGANPQAISRMARRYSLTQLESQRFPLIGSTLYRWRIGGRRSVANVVGALQRERIVAAVQPNYVFTLQEQAVKSPAGLQGDPAQYVLGKLQVVQAHRVATGRNILVAVIDSAIDLQHPDLVGTIAKSFDALGGKHHPHQHGTAIAGAIAAHGKLLGIAPSARLLAVRAFDDTPGNAKGTSFAIYKGLQWAADQNARVANMSFAGPADPTLHRMLAAAYAKGMVLVAAAGNTGPRAAPLYPAADPVVMAVTATDNYDRLFQLANRGRYIAVAAPGVEILALAPGDAYQITTGTSVAAAHVSGIAALLLERKPSLKPKDVRAIITATARPLGPAGRHSEFGAGLANAYRAVMSLNGKSVAKSHDEQAKQ